MPNFLTRTVDTLTKRPVDGQNVDEFTRQTLLDPEVTHRGSALPLGRDAEGDITPALPEAGIEFFKALVTALNPGAASPEDVTNLALTAGTGGVGASSAVGVPKGSLGTFAGRRGLENRLRKPSSKEDFQAAQRQRINLDKAVRMLRKGEDRRKVWEETGWFRGADGKMRFEIGDENVKFDSSQEQFRPKNLDTVLTHPELFDTHPKLKTTRLIKSGSSKGMFIKSPQGSFSPDVFDTTGGTIRFAKDLDDPQSVLLHETQHAIQHREGFARGGSPSQFTPLDEILSQPEVMVVKKFRAIGKAAKEKNLNYKTLLVKNADKIGRDVVKKMLDRNLTQEQFEKLALAIERKELTPFQQYELLAGEAEARNVQARRLFTPEQRKRIPPWMSLDVPEDRLLLSPERRKTR